MRRHLPGRLAVLVAALALALTAAGCAGVPTEGPITEVEARGEGSPTSPMYIVPLPPQKGQSQSAIVKGFLDAMQATPIQTNTARQFLTETARSQWEPDAGTITYERIESLTGRSSVRLVLDRAVRLDRRGAWRGPLSKEESVFSFRLVRENGEYRIANPPDALIVPESWFEPRFQQVSLYFFEQTTSILVPDPVFVPTGHQFASSLVRRLLEGPDARLGSELRTMLPEGAREGLSVPVSDGLAEIRLSPEGGTALAAGTAEIELLVAQLAWTLRQDPAVDRFRVTVGDQLLQLAGRSEFSVTDESYAPYAANASSRLFGIHDGRLVSGTADSFEPVGGPLGQQERELVSASVSLDAGLAAAVSGQGRQLIVAPVHDSSGEVTPVKTDGENLLRPAWDFAGRAWWLDRTAAGARLGYVENGTARDIEIAGITGRDVTDFLISRDGTRLVAVVRDRDRDRIVVSRIRHAADGAVLQGTGATAIGAEPAGQVVDLSWHSPAHVLVATRLSSEATDLGVYTVDGSPSRLTGLPPTLRGVAPQLVTSPAPEDRPYAVQESTLNELTGGRQAIELPEGTTSVGYPG